MIMHVLTYGAHVYDTLQACVSDAQQTRMDVAGVLHALVAKITAAMCSVTDVTPAAGHL